MKKTCLPLLLSALLLTSLSTSVTAATISQTAGYGYNTVTNTWEMEDCAWGISKQGNVNSTDTLSFNKFNSSLGTLTGVALNLYSDGGGSLTVTNNDADGNTLTLNNLLNGVKIIALLPFYGTHTDTFNGLGLPSATSLDVGQQYSTGNEIFPVQNHLFDYTQLNDASFIGAVGSKLLIPIGAKNNATISYSDGNPTLAFDNGAGIYATLDYTYTPPVPEPATYALVCMGLGMLGLLRKRNGKNIA